MVKAKETVLDLLAKARRRRELETQRAVWKTFGVDYEVEKAKQQAIWNELQRKRRKGKNPLQRRYLLNFLRALEKVDFQEKRVQILADFEELAELADKYALDENVKLGPFERLKWARIEAYTYRIIAVMMMPPYDSVEEAKQKLNELKKIINDELGN
jgi:hypothetical protein